MPGGYPWGSCSVYWNYNNSLQIIKSPCQWSFSFSQFFFQSRILMPHGSNRQISHFHILPMSPCAWRVSQIMQKGMHKRRAEWKGILALKVQHEEDICAFLSAQPLSLLFLFHIRVLWCINNAALLTTFVQFVTVSAHVYIMCAHVHHVMWGFSFHLYKKT